jgi:hypothetical protein
VDALTSRTNPSSLEAARRSSLSTALYRTHICVSNVRSTTTLLEALTAFIQQIELSSVPEINQECLGFLKDCTSNVSAFKNLYGNILAFATSYGEKLDDSVIVDKKKMRKDFGVRCISGSISHGRKFISNF